jgi:hypothetical protein
MSGGTGEFKLRFNYHHDEHGVLFDWHKSRANTGLEDILIGNDEEPSFDGYLQSIGLRHRSTSPP